MKLMYCTQCGEICAPWPHPEVPRRCSCGRYAVWWLDPMRGIIRFYDAYYPMQITPPVTDQHVWLIGITNSFLNMKNESMTKEGIALMLEQHEDFYLFKRLHSPIIRVRPGASSDSAWAELPGHSRRPNNDNDNRPASS